jgi:hypothetical protein
MLKTTEQLVPFYLEVSSQRILWVTKEMRSLLVEVNSLTLSLSLSLSHTHTHTNFIFLVVFIDGTHCVDVAVTSGTLDAIRERMKSMQLAAATGNPDSGSRPLMSMNENLNNGLSSQVLRAPDSTGMENPLHSGVLPMDEKALSGLQARMERLKSGSLEPL